MHRFYTEEPVTEGIARLSPEDTAHALRVLRLRPGDEVELLDGSARYAATLLAPEGDALRAQILRPLPSTEARLRVTLYQGLPKGEKMDWIVQKSVELGAAAIVPVSMSRCVVKLDAKDGAKKQARWQKIAREAAKQSGRCQLPAVEAPLPFSQLPKRLAAHQAALVPWEEAEGFSLSRFHGVHPEATDIALVIGPEGGISAEEIRAMAEAGAQAVTLGPRILRTETAPLAALSGLFVLWGDME